MSLCKPNIGIEMGGPFQVLYPHGLFMVVVLFSAELAFMFRLLETVQKRCHHKSEVVVDKRREVRVQTK